VIFAPHAFDSASAGFVEGDGNSPRKPMTGASRITPATRLSPHYPLTVARLGLSAERPGLRAHATAQSKEK